MQRRNREVQIFNLSMLDVMTGALGAVMIIMIVLLTQKIGAEEDKSPTKLTKNAEVLVTNTEEVLEKLKVLEKKEKISKEEAKKLVKKANELLEKAKKLTTKALDISKKKIFLKSWEEELKKLKEELKKREEAVKKIESQLKVKPPVTEVSGGKVGFKIPKKVVLMIDLSGSMVRNNDNENRMDQVRAGLKMMIATMSKESQLDVVFFPALGNLKNTPECKKLYTVPDECKKVKVKVEAYKDSSINCYKYGSFNNKLVSLKDDNSKYDFYKKLSCLKASYATPTIPTLKYVLETYKDAEGIILYSDGSPDSLKSKKHPNAKPVDQLLSEVKAMNVNNKKIYTIGVGSEFRNNKNTPAVNFLKGLAKDNDGYFVGF